MAAFNGAENLVLQAGFALGEALIELHNFWTKNHKEDWFRDSYRVKTWEAFLLARGITKSVDWVRKLRQLALLVRL